MYSFDPADAAEKCIGWIRDFFENNGKGCSAIIGISGGKDSSITAALLVKALGRDRVIGVMMPEGVQSDIEYARGIAKELGIRTVTVNVGETVKTLKAELGESMELTRQAEINIPPRIRMATLYAVSATFNGRVVNTCNLSEDWVGYATRYGDGAGDFGPISGFTVGEVKEIGRYLGVPEIYIEKPPSDGLCGKTDEDNLGFTYKELDDYIRKGVSPSPEKKERIDELHKKNLFKLAYMPTFNYKAE